MSAFRVTPGPHASAPGNSCRALGLVRIELPFEREHLQVLRMRWVTSANALEVVCDLGLFILLQSMHLHVCKQ